METSVAVWRELNGVVGRYIRGVVLDGLVVAVLAALGLWAVRVPYPLLLGAFAGIANAVPFVGPLLSAAAATLVVLLTPGMGLGGVVRVVVLFLFITSIGGSSRAAACAPARDAWSGDRAGSGARRGP